MDLIDVPIFINMEHVNSMDLEMGSTEEHVTFITIRSRQLLPFLLASISIPLDPMGSVSQLGAIHQTTKSLPLEREKEQGERYRERQNQSEREKEHQGEKNDQGTLMQPQILITLTTPIWRGNVLIPP